MNEDMSDLPQAIAADPDGVQVALRAAHTLWSRGDTAESLKWLRKAAESASDEGADMRSLQLAKAAAELRAKLFGTSEPPRYPAGAASPASGSASATGGGAFAGGSFAGAASLAPGVQGVGAFPPSAIAPGESGSHPIAQTRSESAPARVASLSSAPPVEAFAAGALDESTGGSASRPVTATQYPSHRPRQRIGLLSATPNVPRDGTAYAAVPSWSADSERRPSGAPPPLPRASLDDYEELEAEPDEEPADDPGSVWSSGGTDSWRPAELRSAVTGGATPPPLPPRGAFSDDDTEFTQQTEAQRGVLPTLEDDTDAAPHSTREATPAAAAFSGQSHGSGGNAWDQQARMPSWERDPGSPSWAAELHQSTWGGPPSFGDPTAPSNGSDGMTEPSEAAPQSETARARLTARVHHQAVRVSLAPDLRVPGQFVVRPLREGEKAATGERIALLVALEPGVPLV